MKLFKKFLKYWITLSSVAGFLVGWVFVSQSSETEFANTANSDAAQVETITLPPVTSLDSLVGDDRRQTTQVQPFTIIQSSPIQPRIGTGGS